MMRYSMLILALTAAGALRAQDTAASVAGLQAAYNGQKGKITAAAQAMPEDGYTLVPGNGSRTFAAAVGHIADAQAGSCGAVAGTPTRLGAEQMTSKADLEAALAKSFELCDAAYGGTNASNYDAATAGPFGPPQARNVLLWNNVAHSEEMYGTLGVYLRIKGIVPPSTAARGGRGKGKGGKGRGRGN